MCGIVGFLRTTKNNNFQEFLPMDKVKAALRDLTYFNRLRGIDALGMMKVSYQGNCDTIKEVGDPYTLFLKDKKFDDFLKFCGDNRAVALHNRHATKGEKTVECAHPYTETRSSGSSIVLMHNGTIHHNTKEKEYIGHTDSHTLAKMLADDLSLREIENEIWGAYALVWYDSKDHTMNFTRNKERPFGFAFSTKSIWFGSELYMVAAGAKRNDFEMKQFEFLPEMEHWKWHIEDSKFEKFKIPEKTYPVSVSGLVNAKSDEEEAGYEETDVCGLPADYPKSASVQHGGLGIVPYHPNSTVQTSAGTSSDPPFTRRGNYEYRRTSKKNTWGQIEEHLGFKVGSIVTCSIRTFEPIPNRTQISLLAHLVTLDGPSVEVGRTRIHFGVEIIGMVGLSPEVFAASKKLWQGTITEISARRMDGTTAMQYRFRLRGMEECKKDIDDPYYNIQRSYNSLTTNSAINTTKEFISKWESQMQGKGASTIDHQTGEILGHDGNPLEPTTQATPLPPTKSTSDLSSEKSEDTSTNCDSCGTTPSRHTITNKRSFDMPVSVRLCRQCFTSAVCDDTLYERIFTQKYESRKYSNPGEKFYSGIVPGTTLH